MNAFRPVAVVSFLLLTAVSCSSQQNGTQSFVDLSFVDFVERAEKRSKAAVQAYVEVQETVGKQWNKVFITVGKYDVKKTDSTLKPLIGHVEVKLLARIMDDNQKLVDSEAVDYHLDFTQADDGSWEFEAGSQESGRSGRYEPIHHERLSFLPHHLKVLFGL